MGKLIHMIVDNFTKVNQRALMELKCGLACYLQARSMHNTEVTDIVAAVTTDDHELGFPKLLVVGNDKVVAITLSNLVLG